MVISVASGKGGTGKTTVAVNLALTLEDVQFLDCDVEEPDAHIFLKPNIQEKKEAYIPVPKVDEDKCNYCGRCGEVCAYNAIAVLQGSVKGKGSVMIFHHLCHGCGACMELCPRQAISAGKKIVGQVRSGRAGDLSFVDGRLEDGQPSAVPSGAKANQRRVRAQRTGRPAARTASAVPQPACEACSSAPTSFSRPKRTAACSSAWASLRPRVRA